MFWKSAAESFLSFSTLSSTLRCTAMVVSTEYIRKSKGATCTSSTGDSIVRSVRSMLRCLRGTCSTTGRLRSRGKSRPRHQCRSGRSRSRLRRPCRSDPCRSDRSQSRLRRLCLHMCWQRSDWRLIGGVSGSMRSLHRRPFLRMSRSRIRRLRGGLCHPRSARLKGLVVGRHQWGRLRRCRRVPWERSLRQREGRLRRRLRQGASPPLRSTYQ